MYWDGGDNVLGVHTIRPRCLHDEDVHATEEF